MTGSTSSSDFPTNNAFQPVSAGNFDVFVAKFNSRGALVFSTYFGGTAADSGSAIAVDSAGNSYITGYTFSGNFRIKNAYQDSKNGDTNAFITKFNSNGSLVFSTYLGGQSSGWPSYYQGTGVAVDNTGDCFVTGWTDDGFPTKNAYNSTYGGQGDIFVAKFSFSGKLIFNTYFGGSSTDFATSIAVDSAGNSYITGYTKSTNFPTKHAYNSTYGGWSNVFVSKFSSTGKLIFSSYFGGKYEDIGSSIAVDSAGNSYITGYTKSANFPTKHSFNDTFSGEQDIFVTKFDSTGGLVFSTFLGGGNSDFNIDIAVDRSGNSYITGPIDSNNFPFTRGYNDTRINHDDFFIVKFSPFSSSSPKNQFIYQIEIFILFSGALVGISLVILYSIVEYRKYSKIKNSPLSENSVSFKFFLKRKLVRHSKQLKSSSRPTDKIFDLVDEIEKENTPDD